MPADPAVVALYRGPVAMMAAGLLLWVAIDREPFLLILVVPITALSAWGWWMEWRAFPVRFGPPGR